MWPFKKKNDTPETIKHEINPENAKPKITGKFIFNAEATKKMLEKREPNIISISKMSKNIASMSDEDLSIYLYSNFGGHFFIAQKEDYRLGWMEYISEGEKAAKFLLIEKNEIILSGKMIRPMEGKVATNGTFILSDWHSEDEYGGIFYVIRKDGVVIVQCKVKANLGNTGISDDGNYAVCQTWNSPISPEDSNKLFFFDLTKPVLVWSCEPEPGQADSIRFDNKNKILFLDYNNGKSYQYDYDGHFLDSEKWQKDRADNANGYELLTIADELIESIGNSASDIDQFNEAFSIIKKALEKGVSEYTQSTVYRQLGEIYMKFNKNSEAIKHFEKALSLNPKIGLKKILAKLKNPDVS